MADTKTTALTGFTPILTDLLYGVDDPGGTPISGKVTFTDVRTLLEANLVQPIITVAAANTAALVSTGYSLTGADTTPMLNLAGTWNTTGIATGIKLNITNTASATGSKLLDLQVNNFSTVSSDKAGAITFHEGTGGTSHRLEIGYNKVIHYRSGNAGATIKGTAATSFVGMFINKTGLPMLWSSDPSVGTTINLQLICTTSNILEQYNGTAAQAFRVYNTWTNASNYEHVALRYSANIAELGSFALGTGTLRGLSIGVTSNAVGFMGATPIVRFTTTGTVTGFTAGVGTAVLDDSTFTGNSGTAAYTIGDVVLALKNYGLLAAS